MTSLIETLNLNAGRTPDEIVAAVNDPLAKWQSMTTFVTPDNWPELRDREVAIYFRDHNPPSESTGFYCTDRHQMSGGCYSYRSETPVGATMQQMREYNPSTAQGCGGWWVIGWGYHLTAPIPTTAAAMSHNDYDEPDEEFEDDDPDY